jgi:hypothetical protein
MRAFLAVGLVLAIPASADVKVRGSGPGQFDVHAAAAPLSEVLEKLAAETGMKVVYDGPAPRSLVNLDLSGRTPAQAVLGVLEGLGLNYALRLDATGDRVETLILFPASPGSGPLPTPPTPRAVAVPGDEEPNAPDEDELAAELPAPPPAAGVLPTPSFAPSGVSPPILPGMQPLFLPGVLPLASPQPAAVAPGGTPPVPSSLVPAPAPSPKP